jgi:hypothetical protein
MHRGRGAREPDGASGRCGGGPSRRATAGMSDASSLGLPTGREYSRVHRVCRCSLPPGHCQLKIANDADAPYSFTTGCVWDPLSAPSLATYNGSC